MISDLVDRLPPLLGPPDIEAKYDLPPEARRLRCAHCGSRLHRKGYVLRLPSGQRALLAARHCGRAEFGLDWLSVEQAFSERVERRLDLGRLLRVNEVLGDAVAEAEDLTRDQAFAIYDAKLGLLKGELSWLGRALAKAARADGRLEATEQVRDPDAEDRNARRVIAYKFSTAEDPKSTDAERRAANGEIRYWIERHGQFFKTRPVYLGQCAGIGAVQYRSLQAMLKEAVGAIATTASTLAGTNTEDWADRALTGALARLSNDLEAVRAATSLLHQLERLCSPENRGFMKRWADSDVAVRTQFKTGSMGERCEVAGRTGDIAKLALPDDYSVPKTPMLDRLQTALRGETGAGV